MYPFLRLHKSNGDAKRRIGLQPPRGHPSDDTPARLIFHAAVAAAGGHRYLRAQILLGVWHRAGPAFSGNPLFMELLKLAALDADDLSVISAHLQDAVLRAGDLAWLADRHRFVLVARRFDHSVAPGEAPRRRLVGVHFERVNGVKARNLKASGLTPGGESETTLSLLAVTFDPGEAPSGTATLVFAGGAAIRLDLECIEVRMKDLGPVWEAEGRPDHEAVEAGCAALQGRS